MAANNVVIPPVDNVNGTNFQCDCTNRRVSLIFVVVIGCIFGAIMYGVNDEYDPELVRMVFDGSFSFLQMYDSLLKMREKYGEFDNLNMDGSGMVSLEHPSKEWVDSLHIGSLVDALDVESKWYNALVVDIGKNGNKNSNKYENKVKIHFQDWPNRFDEWIDKYSGKIVPFNTQAIGGRNQGGLPGWPMLPLRNNNDNNNDNDNNNGNKKHDGSTKFVNDFELKCDENDINENQWLELICKKWYFTGKYSQGNGNNYEYPIWLNGGYFITYSTKLDKFVITRKLEQFNGDINDINNVVGHLEWYTLTLSSSKKSTKNVKEFLFSSQESKHYEIVIKKIDYENSVNLRFRNKRVVNHDSIAPIMPRIELNNGVIMPFMGLGTAGLTYDELNNILKDGIESGYTMIDTGYDHISNKLYYNHHKLISSMITKYGRTNLFISTKIGCDNFGYMSTIRNIKYQIEKLETKYLDLVVISQPQCCSIMSDSNNNNKEKCQETWLETWRALEHLYKKKRIRALGVSQFGIDLLEQLFVLKQNDVPLSVVRGWRDPLHPNNEIAKFCQENGIIFQAFSPLGGQHLLKATIKANPVLKNPTIKKISSKSGGKYSKAQVVIKWNQQQSISIIVKSSNIKHLKENIQTLSLNDLPSEQLSDINYISYMNDDEFEIESEESHDSESDQSYQEMDREL